MIGKPQVYALAGLVFAAYAVLGLLDKKRSGAWKNTAFWGLLGISFLAGDQLGDFGNGLLVIAMVLLAGVGGLMPAEQESRTPTQRQASAQRLGSKLFIPALMMPLLTVVGSSVFKQLATQGYAIVDPAQATLVALSMSAVVAALSAVILLRQPAVAPATEGRRLMDSVGWAAILPQMLATLGAVFAIAGVGPIVGQLAAQVIPGDSRLAAVVVYTCGMAGFTLVMGNAFAAFPVMTVGIGLPLIVHRFGGDPAIMSALGMLSGFCGTLMTPMAANFNIVPTALLGIKDRYAVIKVQVPTALFMLVFNTIAMYALVWR